ncbi:MAG: sugar ABC transporter permease [Chloroflexi bacterium]|nr:sugar ABC transporter permease [Chloroflexota bacterium]
MTLISQGYNTMIGALRTRDQAFLKGLQITIYYAFGSIPLQLGLGLLLAYVLHSRIKAKALFRTIFFLPYVTPAVAAAVVFGTVFSARATSPMNQLVQLFGGDVQRWLAEPRPFLNVVFGLNLEGFIAGPSMALVVVIILGI